MKKHQHKKGLSLLEQPHDKIKKQRDKYLPGSFLTSDWILVFIADEKTA